MNRDWLIRQLPPGGGELVALTERGNDLMIDRAHFDPPQGRSRTERIIVRGGRIRRVRFSLALPSLSELSTWLNDAGFGDIAVYGEAGEPLRLDSRRMLVSARR